MILLDTNVCIQMLRGNSEVLQAYAENAGNVAVSFMSVGELYYGAAKSSNPERNRLVVRRFLEVVPVIHSTDRAMIKFGELKAELAMKGQMVEDADILIAATALTQGADIATGNVRHFRRFKGLSILRWI